MKSPTFKHIHRIGIELEGGWNKLMPDVCIGRDGSVSTNATHSGELPSPPLYPFRFEAWLRNHHPHVTNNSCGMHVHLSVRSPRDYSRLMKRQFFNLFIKEAEVFGKSLNLPLNHEYWARLSGHNSYCLKVFRPMAQFRQTGKGGDRYTQLNFCWNLHGTMECRLFPAFEKPDHSVAAVKWLLNLTETYLRGFKRREKTEVLKIYAGMPLPPEPPAEPEEDVEVPDEFADEETFDDEEDSN
jgi:hypothetical protein